MALESRSAASQDRNQVETKNGSNAREKRLVTIDTMKGMSMIMIWYCHFWWGWHANDWTSFGRFQWLMLDFFGPIMFLSMSVLGTMLSLANNKSTGGKPGHTSQSLARISYLFIIGECINLYTLWHLGLFHVFGWNIITTIACFSLLVPYIVRLKPAARMALIVGIALIYYPLVNLLMTNIRATGVNPDDIAVGDLTNSLTIIYFLFFHHGMMAPVFSWTIVPLAVSLIFEPLIASYKRATPTQIHAELKRIFAAGAIMVAGSLLLGGFSIGPGYSPGVMHELNEPGLLSWPIAEGFPAFLDRHTPHYMFYMLGLLCMLFALLCEYQHVRGRQVISERKINNFGVLSLTAYVLSHLALVFNGLSLSFFPFAIIFIPLLDMTVNLFDLWTRRKSGRFSLEWFMGAYLGVVRAIGAKFSRVSGNPWYDSPRKNEPDDV